MRGARPILAPGSDRPTPFSRRRLLGGFSLGAAGLALTACGGMQVANVSRPAADGTGAAFPDFSARFAEFEPADEPNGDLAKVVWPEWMARLDPEVKRLYEFQIENGNLMRYMPCFCGCQWEDGHRSNRDCYVEAVNPDGSVVFDSMAPT